MEGRTKLKKDQPAKKQTGPAKIDLHCETIIFSGKSFIKREDFEKWDLGYL